MKRLNPVAVPVPEVDLSESVPEVGIQRGIPGTGRYTSPADLELLCVDARVRPTGENEDGEVGDSNEDDDGVKRVTNFCSK